MAVYLSDEDVARLVEERKPLPGDYAKRLELRSKRGHKESQLELKGEQGSDFVLIIRQSLSNPLDFSVILGYKKPNSNRVFHLRRYNGKSHEHSNRIEGERFYDFHVHEATERYQELGADEENYAAASDRFTTVDEAINCVVEDCGFERPPDPQGRLFRRI